MTTIAERVAAGAAFLDTHDPDWWRADVERAINLDTLVLIDSSMCVLGQRCPLETLAAYTDIEEDVYEGAYDRYFAYGLALMKAVGDSRPLRIWAHEHGFNNGPDDPDVFDRDDAWDDLTAEWKRVIEARRSA